MVRSVLLSSEILFDLASRQQIVHELEQQMMTDGFWDDRRGAQKIIDRLNQQRKILDVYHGLEQAYAQATETLEMLKEEFDPELSEMFSEEVLQTSKQLDNFEIMVLLSHDYDHKNAILEIHPGAGGTESQDWASMLLRMYTRWAEQEGFKVQTIDYQEGEEAGIKSVSLLISGDFAYGYLKAEKGVHRLVRISPFDSSGRRHTSFASVEVVPEFNDDVSIEINPVDLVVETHRASGAGGQHINKTDSAVRIIHKPTGLVASSQSQRSQLQNRETAMNMLKSKLYQLMIEEKVEKLNQIKGEMKANEWGSQIRSYVFHPYSLVKDLRTGIETSNIQAVMDGDLDAFIYAYLKQQVKSAKTV